ncbi:MAG: radical SAM protein [Bacteroidales bacterium]|nr:radical SAM protein [Bacteroidales bacterium]MCF8387892.1 radical SAM protein [Bacteroidales bacterium]MCF8399425.1 radical SAM protein [Bacteroidales bacterium]
MLKLSRFSHQFSLNGKTFLYHALNFKKAVLNDDVVRTNQQGESYLEFDPVYHDDLAKELQEKGILISSDKEDSELLDENRAQIQKPYISTVYFFITNDCNLACRYCFERQSVPEFFKKENMTEDVFIKGLLFFEKLIRRDPEKFRHKKTIIFYGGEPFMNKKLLFYAIEQIQKHKAQGILPEETHIIVVTNGVLINAGDVDFIKSHDVTLTFSIDGDRKACSNRVFPGKQEAFEQIIEKYTICRDAGININIACTLTPETIDNFDPCIDFFIHDLKISNIGFNALLDNGIIQIPDHYDDAAAAFVAKAGRILEEHGISENRTGRRKQVYQAGKACIFDCNAQGGRQIAIAPGGEVGICHEHIADRKHFVTDIDQDFVPEEDPVFLEWAKRSPLYIEKCLDCPALGLCGGGCVINTEQKHQSIWEPDDRFCKQTLAILKDLLVMNNEI